MAFFGPWIPASRAFEFERILSERQMNLYLNPIDAFLEILEESPFMTSSMKQLLDNLVFLKAFLMDPPKQFSEDDILMKEIQFLAWKIENIFEMDLDMTCFPEIQLTTALTPMSRWMSAARRIYEERPKPPRIYYPTTSRLSFVDHLVDKLDELLVKAKVDHSIANMKPYILRLQRKMRFLSCRLMEIPQPRKEEAHLKDITRSIGNLAYEAEHAIDSYLVGEVPVWHCMFWLRDILEELNHQWRLIKMESGDLQSILSCIVNTEPIELKIVPIVKNTEISDKLEEVFTHSAMVYSFSVRTRSLVSSSYRERKKEVFLNLLCNVSYAPYVEEDSDKIEYTSGMSEAQLKLLLFGILENSRYFIILEDVGDIDALNDIREVLPNNGFGSRILLTTSSPELALQCHHDFQKALLDHTTKSQTNKLTIEDDVVGFKAETEGMLEQLIRGPKKLHIISIFGMPGQGKTTLAKKLFSDPLVVHYFHTRAWYCVSQVYEKRELLLELLCQIDQHSHTIHTKNDVELAETLYKNLKGQRFLIFLDDMWKIDAWKDLSRCFPNDNNGSRIIFTTRMQELASQARSDSILQPLCPLSDKESWELLMKKVFPKESCPPELLEVGKKIAKNCRGLPLSVVLTAGLLAKMEKNVINWENIAQTLSSRILRDAEAYGKGIIQLSYKHLSDPLKPCFLYFGAFLEDKQVPVKKLMRLWIAEGFIRHIDSSSLEDVADDYLMDLIGRSLVTVAEEKSNGGVKSCRIHDLLREFCLIKASEENFLQQINGYDEYFSPSNYNLDYGMDPNYSSDNDNLDYGVDPYYSYSSTSITYYLCRLCIYSKRNHFTMLKPCSPSSLPVRSLLFFAASDKCPNYSYDISFIFRNFKFLKILVLEDINMGDSISEIIVLVLLRYLAIQGSVDFIPSSIANLRDLETFLFKGSSAKIVKVPDSIWDMMKLRHVHINNSGAFDLDVHRLENSSILHNLQTFSTPSLAYSDDMEKLLRRLRGIRKLKCIFLDSWDDVRNCNQFPELGFLSKLLSLKVFYNGEGKYPRVFNFPSNLTKLTLSNFRMSWNEISQLATLGNLEVLKLLGRSFEGETWEMEDEVFPKLKLLKLDTHNIVEWSATSDHFPRLERLLLHKCEQLEEIPPGIGDIPTLQMIEVMWCTHSAAVSAIKIQEEQLEFGDERLKIHLYPKVWDSESLV